VRHKRIIVENKIAVEPVPTNEASLTVEVEQPQRLFTEKSKMNA
jgi:hypothetical protein